jgi:hypothetical protein
MGGKTFGNNINLSNSSKSGTQDAQIAAGNNGYVSWWKEMQRVMSQLFEYVMITASLLGKR